MFVGRYERSLDSKFRIVLPKKFRVDLGPRVYLAQADNSLGVYSEEAYEELSQRLIDQYRRGEIHPGTLRTFGSSSVRVEPDEKTGRITLPQKLREDANLTNEVIVAGVLTHVEVWDKATFEAVDEKNSDVMREHLQVKGTFN